MMTVYRGGLSDGFVCLEGRRDAKKKDLQDDGRLTIARKRELGMGLEVANGQRGGGGGLLLDVDDCDGARPARSNDSAGCE